MPAQNRPSMAIRVSGALEVRPLTTERWQDLVRLFGPNGAGHCWCTWWRQTGAEFGRGIEERGRGNCALMQSLAGNTPAPGLIGYRAREPVGWVSVGPRPGYGRVVRSPTLGPGRHHPDAGDASVWSVVCFWMPRRERGKGLASQLLGAAVEHARTSGARALEAYPIDTAGGRHPTASLFTGTLGMFLRAGFQEVERRSEGRPIVRLALPGGAAPVS